MKKSIIIILQILLISVTFSCYKKNNDLNFYSCDFQFESFDNPVEKCKWIENKQDAINSKLTFTKNIELNKRNLDSLYKTKVQCLFFSGGPGSNVIPEEGSADIKNDTIFIYFEEIERGNEIGVYEPTYICLEINRLKYPNYKKMKIVFRSEKLN